MGSALTARHGGWSPAPASYAYRWYRNGVRIPGADSQAYRPVARDLGARLKVRVTAKLGGYQRAALTTPPTAKVGRRS